MTTSDRPMTRAERAAAFWAKISPEERSRRMKQLRALNKTNPGGFKAGDPRVKEIGRKGGLATGPRKSRDMKGVQRVKQQTTLTRQPKEPNHDA